MWLEFGNVVFKIRDEVGETDLQEKEGVLLFARPCVC